MKARTELEAVELGIEIFESIYGKDKMESRFPNHTDRDVWLSGFIACVREFNTINNE